MKLIAYTMIQSNEVNRKAREAAKAKAKAETKAKLARLAKEQAEADARIDALHAKYGDVDLLDLFFNGDKYAI